MKKECNHPTCGDTCRREKKPKKGYRANANPANQMGLSLTLLFKSAQATFNLFIRLRDKKHGCISCNKGVVEHAGHYYPLGSFSGVRFDEINVNGQDVPCNCGDYGNLEMYRQGLINKWGLKAVEELDERAKVTKVYRWQRSELIDIINKYKIKIRELR